MFYPPHSGAEEDLKTPGTPDPYTGSGYSRSSKPGRVKSTPDDPDMAYEEVSAHAHCVHFPPLRDLV